MEDSKIFRLLIRFFLFCVVSANAGAVEHPLGTETAFFAGGCFWCMQPPFDNVDGVLKTVVGYTGGAIKNPDYKTVSAGETGHYEAVEITYDPEKISYRDLPEIFRRNIDPTNEGGQFCDVGDQYRSAIFYSNDAQTLTAKESEARAVSPR
ncbi:MAG: peptide-methionine (S)-S-oxide reductase MsrA [Gammaproteobacteria bacterium]